MSASVPNGHQIYVDGSLQGDGSEACAVYSPTMEPPRGDEWVGRRLPNSSSSTHCELQGLLDAVTLLNHMLVNGIVVCDSQSALQALSSISSVCDHVVQNTALNIHCKG